MKKRSIGTDDEIMGGVEYDCQKRLLFPGYAFLLMSVLKKYKKEEG